VSRGAVVAPGHAKTHHIQLALITRTLQPPHMQHKPNSSWRKKRKVKLLKSTPSHIEETGSFVGC